MFRASRIRSARSRLAVLVAAGSVATAVGLGAPAAAPATATGAKKIASYSDGSSSSRKSIKLKRPSGTTEGHVMVAAVVSNDDDHDFSAPSGWTEVRDGVLPDRLRQVIYVKVAGASEPSSYTWKLGHSRRIAGGITTYAGVDTTAPVAAHGALISTAATRAVPAPAITTPTSALLVHVAAISAEGKLTAPPGMSARWKAASPNKKTADDVLVALADGEVPAGDTGARAAPATKAGPGIGVVLALRPTAAVAPSDPGPLPSDPGPPPAGPRPVDVLPPGGDPVLVGAGDIAACSDNSGAKATAKLLDAIPGTVFTLGDNAYVDGTAKEFANCYEPTWGRHKAHTAFVLPGNHDYNTDGAAAYYDYFGATAGDRTKGYYDATLGAWHVVVLNSNCAEIGGCGPGSPQEVWLRQVLAASTARCTLAMWHQPAFSSATRHLNFPEYLPFWAALHDYGADVVLVASDHVYERFGLQDATGQADAVGGLRQFTVGTGGRNHQAFKTPLPNSEVRNGSTFGVLKLTLHADSYDWQFVPVAGQTFTDQGTTACH